MLNLCRAVPFLAVLAWAGWSSRTEAAYVYQYTFGQSNYQVLPGQTVAVDVYLQETVTEGDISWFTGPNRGLFGGGVRVFFNETPLPTDLAEVTNVPSLVANIIPNILFTDPTKTRSLNPGISAGLIAAVNFPTDNLIQGTPLNATPSRILLGTFNFTAGLINNEVTHLLATDFNTSQPSLNENTVFNSITLDSVDLDSLILTSTATITTIPEPSTWISGLMIVTILSWRIRKFAK